jgi:ArsR family transcriptional regulator
VNSLASILWKTTGKTRTTNFRLKDRRGSLLFESPFGTMVLSNRDRASTFFPREMRVPMDTEAPSQHERMSIIIGMDPNRFQRIAKALADPRRFEIFEEMATSPDELACGRIVERFPITQATVSHHLKELTDAGLVEIRPEGQFRYCRARLDVLQEYIHELERRAGLTRKRRTSTKRNAR